jgi:transcriptional regulator with GAF, ATPase, and Fis domain
MQLVADRFAAHKDGRVFDLSTGAPVTLVIGSAGGVSEQLRWGERCDALRALRHPAMAPLIDYGLFGVSSRFEVWGCGGALRRRDDGNAIHARASRWLRACGRSAAACRPDSIRSASDGREVWLPEAGTGYPEAAIDDEDVSLSIDDRGLQIVERPVVTILAEMFQAADARPSVSVLWGPPGGGKRIVVGELARIARTTGHIPIAASLISSCQAQLWEGRSLFVIADSAQEGVWQAFLNASLKDAQRHVLLLVGEREHPLIGGVHVGRLSIDEMTSAVRPQAAHRRLAQHVRRAAERAHGLPGRFAHLLWPDWATQHRPRSSAVPSRVSRVAEQRAVYGHQQSADEVFNTPPIIGAWPAPGELAALRRRMDGAIDDVSRGRHAPGIRQLRQVVGCLARRGAWVDASRGAQSLSAALLRRGRPRDALAAAADGRDYATHGGDEPALVEFAIVGGNARIDLGRLDEAESVLGTALVVARALREPERETAVSFALARASYWRGAYADAEALLNRDPISPRLRIQRSLLASRIAVAQGDPGRAMSMATAAAAAANEDGDPATRASAAWVIALVRFAVGDLAAVERDLSDALALARAARDPQRAIRVRLLRVEVERARGRPAIVDAHLGHLRRLVATVPAIVRARWDLATTLSGPESRRPEAIARHVRASGFASLGVYVARSQSFRGFTCRQVRDSDTPVIDAVHAEAPSIAAETFVEELVAILRVCQTAADEIELLKEVCGRLRQHLHAAAVAFVTVRGGLTNVVASAGSRLETEIAQRAAAAGTTIPPHCHHDRVEAAAPIVYGGETIGAICARWTIGSTYDNSRAGSVLTMSAAVAAPVLSAIVVRHVRGDEIAGELIGITPGMVALRQSVARAAAAPFGVLVDGESGSGKELVARAIHRGSGRRHKAFCALNCAALPDDLVEAELFGHARGAFTGAVGDRPGVFEEAHGGTLFLDEIGELTPRAQAKVLRVIQDGELRRVGENVTRRIDVRIVSATNRALCDEVDAGRFRLDLLYRLDVVHITVPPLRDRREDIALLAEHFWRDATGRVGSRATLGASTLAALARHDWPGNVRELQNVLAALAVRTPKRGVVPPSALPPQFGERGSTERWSLDEARRTFEVSFVRAALVRTGGHRGRAAAELGVTRQGLSKLMSRLGIAT